MRGYKAGHLALVPSSLFFSLTTKNEDTETLLLGTTVPCLIICCSLGEEAQLLE